MQFADLMRLRHIALIFSVGRHRVHGFAAGLPIGKPCRDAWLDENCGSDGWMITPSGMDGALSEAVSIYFADATFAGAIVARWCARRTAEATGGVFQGMRMNRRRGAGRRDIGYRAGT